MKRQRLTVLVLVAIMATAAWVMMAEASYLDPDTGERYIRPTDAPTVVYVAIDTATPIPVAYPEPVTNTPQPPPPQPPPPTSYPVCLERPAFPCNTPTPQPTPTPPWADGQEGCYVQQDNGLVECGD